MIPHRALVPALVVMGGSLAPARQVAAQDAEGVDFSRAFTVDRTIFEPFLVEETVPLREALAEGVLEPTVALLVMEHAAGRIAVVTDQMAYHHVAQGEIAGEPWMVSF